MALRNIIRIQSFFTIFPSEVAKGLEWTYSYYCMCIIMALYDCMGWSSINRPFCWYYFHLFSQLHSENVSYAAEFNSGKLVYILKCTVCISVLYLRLTC